MNPEQLAKLNGPNTEVADFKLVNEQLEKPVSGVPAEMGVELITDEPLTSARMVWLDFSKTPAEEVAVPEWVDEDAIPPTGPGMREQLKDPDTFYTQPLDKSIKEFTRDNVKPHFKKKKRK